MFFIYIQILAENLKFLSMYIVLNVFVNKNQKFDHLT